MSTVPSRSSTRRGVRRIASSPAVAGFRPAGVALAVAAAFSMQAVQAQSQFQGNVHGTAVITRDGANMRVDTTNGANTAHSVFNWHTFSVPGGSRTWFEQPGAGSTSINRVTGNNLSEIFGTLGSNGRLVLVNPAGITIGKGAIIDTAAFTASTVGMSEADAIAGRLRFSEAGTGVLKMEGKTLVKQGDVYLIAPRIESTADAVFENVNGSVVLAAGQKVELTGRGLEGIVMEVQAGNEVVNLGTLKGDAVGVFAGTLKHSGAIAAHAVTTEGGKVVLKATGGDAIVDGSITAVAGDRGGRIDVLGERVGLMAGANLQASGRLGGGSVRVGGDYQGANPDVANAKRTYVDAAARIQADAIESGNGGRVIVWGDEVTRMHGQISARGGAAGGDGGFAEVSGKEYLEFTGRADLRAPNGTTGTLLLDPNDITIEATGPTDTSKGAVFSGGPASSKIKASDLEAQLATSSVIVATNGSTATASGLITVANDVNLTWSTNNALGLQADGAIDFQGSINATGAGSALSLRAMNGTILQNPSTSVIRVGVLQVKTDNGRVELNGNNLVGTVGATVGGAGNSFWLRNAQALTVGTASSPYGAAQAGITADGDITLITTTGDIAVNQAITSTGSTATVHLEARNGNITQNAVTSVIQAQRLLAFADGGSVALNGANRVNSLTAEVFGGGFSFTNAQTLNLGPGLAPDEAQINGVVADGNVSLAATGAGSNINMAGMTAQSRGGKVTVTAAGNIEGGGNFITLGSTSSDGAAGSVTLTAQGGSVDYGNISTWSQGGTVAHAGNVVVDAKTGITGGGIDAFGTSGPGGNGGDVTLTAQGTNVSVGYIDSYGGYSYGAALPGGDGGTVTIGAKTGIQTGSIDASAGSYSSTAGSGGGGASGNVLLTSGAGTIKTGYIDAVGGGGNVATQGGRIAISTAGDVEVGELYNVGGYGTGTTTGGTGGTVEITAGGNITLMPQFTSLAITSDGGNSDNGTGGVGGRITLKFGGALTIVPDTRSTDALQLTAVAVEGPTTSTGLISASGGAGGFAPTGGTGGAGGFIRVERTGGPLVMDSGVVLFALGGNGGDTSEEVGGAGGTGGKGGEIQLASSSTVTLRSPILVAGGGQGGFNADRSVQGPTGAPGLFSATGTSVEVEGDMYLDAIWGNNSLVNLRGTSVVFGTGRFDNFGTVALYDTAQLAPDAGVFNNKVLTSLGTDTLANLRHNSGLVDVVAGSRLSANGFTSNAGVLQVNGTLDIGDFAVRVPAPPPPPAECSLCGLQAASLTGPVFVNEAAGTLTGTGNIIVAGGTGTIDNFGTIAPGGAEVGTLSLTSNLVMQAGSTVQADLQTTSSHDVIAVSGTAVTGGTYAVTYKEGVSFSAGDVFSMLQAGSLDATTLPAVTAAELSPSTRGNEFVLVANAPVPAVAPPPPAPPFNGEAEQVQNQVVTFATLFLQMAEQQQQEEAKQNEIGKDDIVVTGTACTPR